MKRLIAFLIVLFVSTAFIYSGEITLGFGWRTSDSGLVPGEYSLPFSWTTVFEQYDPVWDEFSKETETRDYVLSKPFNPFLRRACVVFGADFFLYKKQVSLGFELNAGCVERKYDVLLQRILEINGNLIYDATDIWENNRTIIIPINLFLNLKYKFDCIKKATGFLRPYIGIGGGVSAVILIDGLQGISESGTYTIYEDITYDSEKIFNYSRAYLVLGGVDLFFSKSVALFIEGKYIKLLDKGKNFRNQATTVSVGFRFI